MPSAALSGVDADYVVGLAEMPALLERLVKRPEGRRPRRKTAMTSEEIVQQTCPECGGGLTRVRLGGLDEYRCHVGHRLGGQTLIEAKRELRERMILATLAQIEELVALLEATADSQEPSSQTEVWAQVEAHRREIAALRQLVDSPISVGDSAAEPLVQASPQPESAESR